MMPNASVLVPPLDGLACCHTAAEASSGRTSGRMYYYKCVAQNESSDCGRSFRKPILDRPFLYVEIWVHGRTRRTPILADVFPASLT